MTKKTSKKNLPHIPLYIGDWQKDCAALSMTAQGAWLQIIFKLFTTGKQETYKTSTKRLQKLWGCSREGVLEIIEEMQDENICDIAVVTEDGRSLYHFTCRRFVKENAISKARSEAVKNRKDRKTGLQTSYKPSTKRVQTPDNDNDNDNDNVIKFENAKGVAGDLNDNTFEVKAMQMLTQDLEYRPSPLDMSKHLPVLRDQIRRELLKHNLGSEPTVQELCEALRAIVTNLDDWTRRNRYQLSYFVNSFNSVYLSSQAQHHNGNSGRGIDQMVHELTKNAR